MESESVDRSKAHPWQKKSQYKFIAAFCGWVRYLFSFSVFCMDILNEPLAFWEHLFSEWIGNEQYEIVIQNRAIITQLKHATSETLSCYYCTWADCVLCCAVGCYRTFSTAPLAVYIVAVAISKSSNHRHNLSPMSTHFQLLPSLLPSAFTVKSDQSIKQTICWNSVGAKV
jgi:hypothetical protein